MCLASGSVGVVCTVRYWAIVASLVVFFFFFKQKTAYEITR